MMVGWQLLDAVVCDFLLLVVLGARREFNLNITIESSNFYFRAKNCLGYTQVEVCVNV